MLHRGHIHNLAAVRWRQDAVIQGKKGAVMSEQKTTREDEEETVGAFSDELSDEALDRMGTAFCSCRSSLAGDH